MKFLRKGSNKDNDVLLSIKEILQDQKIAIVKDGTPDEMYNLCKKEQYVFTNISDIEKVYIKISAHKECVKVNLISSLVFALLGTAVLLLINDADQNAEFTEKLIAYILMIGLYVVSLSLIKNSFSYVYKIYKNKDKLGVFKNNLNKVEQELINEEEKK